jgi:glycosyltransferase involved in cell wall biosynthesis
MQSSQLYQKSVSIIIPSYKRAHLIKYTLDALQKQVYRNFEVLIILNPTNDGTEAVLESYRKSLNLKIVTRKKPLPITHALNLGLENAQGEIIFFLDDDVVPYPCWLQDHIDNYTDPKVGGVAGNVVSTTIQNLDNAENTRSELILDYTPFLTGLARILWEHPLAGLENYLLYLSRAGTLCTNTKVASLASRMKVRSLLGMGANISVLAEAVSDIRFPEDSWAVGMNWEQYLGFRIWKKGYCLMFDPKPVVKHISEGETATHNVRSNKRYALNYIEHSLMFYRLYDQEKQISKRYRIIWFAFILLTNLWKAHKEKNAKRLVNIAAIVYAELIGVKWLISRKFGGNYSPKADLDKLLNP